VAGANLPRLPLTTARPSATVAGTLMNATYWYPSPA